MKVFSIILNQLSQRIITLGLLILVSLPIKAQLTDGVTGLLHMPNAEMQKDGTLMVGGTYLNTHNHNTLGQRLSPYKYDTFNYYANITFFDFLEVSYVCTLNKGVPGSDYWPEQTWGHYTNQDRHFNVRLRLLKEGQFWRYMPAVVVGSHDPTSGSGGDYSKLNVSGSGNGYFNRWYLAMTKHIETGAGELGVHLAYLYNKRTDYHLNGPAVGFNFKPNFHRNLNFVAEYDAKTVNIGALYSLWHDHFNFLVELQQGKYLSAGVTYKVCLKGGNKW